MIVYLMKNTSLLLFYIWWKIYLFYYFISSDCCVKQYNFRDIRRIDGLGVVVTIYLDTKLRL